MVVKCLGDQVIFILILTVKVQDERRSRWIPQVNNQLCHLCWQQGFGFYNHRTLFEDPQLMGIDGIHLSKWGTRTFAYRLANLLMGALN